jgi:hypothetical protein
MYTHAQPHCLRGGGEPTLALMSRMKAEAA